MMKSLNHKFMIEPNNIYQGDCLEMMDGIADKSIDAIICDLPYGVLNKGNKHAQWDVVIPFAPLWAHYERIIKPHGAIVLFASVRERVQFAEYPECFEGFPICLVSAALVALAFMGFSGMQIF